MIKDISKVIAILKKTNDNSMLARLHTRPKWQILIATILSARSKDEVTEVVAENLFKKYPSLQKFSKAKIKDIEKIIKQTGFYRNKAKNILNTGKMLLKEYKGRVPDNVSELVKFPGVGNKVASCVVVYGYGKEEIPVDVHVAVIAQRLKWTREKHPDKIWKDLKEKIPRKYWMDINELLVVHGRNICYTRKPSCYKCPIERYCYYDKKNI